MSIADYGHSALMENVMNSASQIRYAQENDIDDLVELFSRTVSSLEIYSESARTSEIQKFSSDELSRRIREDRHAVSLAFVGSKLAGFLITEYQHGPIWIDWYGVNPDFRNLGVGKAILKHLIAAAPNRKASKIWCDTRTSNTQSISLLKNLKFERLCEIKNHWHGQDFYLWARDVP
jgi:ribosomal protein S18 acetylase RimI-like enzyme